MQRVGRMMQQITVRHVIPWLTFSDAQEAGEVTDAAGDVVAGQAFWEDTQAPDDPSDPTSRFFDLIDILYIDHPAATSDVAKRLCCKVRRLREGSAWSATRG